MTFDDISARVIQSVVALVVGWVWAKAAKILKDLDAAHARLRVVETALRELTPDKSPTPPAESP